MCGHIECTDQRERQRGTETDSQTYRQAGRQTDRQTGRHADRQTEIQTDRQIGRQADRQTDTGRQTDRQTSMIFNSFANIHLTGFYGTVCVAALCLFVRLFVLFRLFI